MFGQETARHRKQTQPEQSKVKGAWILMPNAAQHAFYLRCYPRERSHTVERFCK